MKEIAIKVLKEVVRIFLTSLLAVLGIHSTGCIASGNNASAAFTVSGK